MIKIKKEKKEKTEKKEKKEKKSVKVTKPKHFKKQKISKKPIDTQGYFASPTQSIINESHIPHPTSHQKQTGVPYTSVFDNFGITNKPPYFLESLIAKTQPMIYEIPIPSQTSTTLNGANNKSQPIPKLFEQQTKSKSVDYIDLVQPAMNGNAETQPDYVLFENEAKKKSRRMKNEMTEANQMGDEDKNMKRLMKQEKIQKIKEEKKNEKKKQMQEINMMGNEDKTSTTTFGKTTFGKSRAKFSATFEKGGSGEKGGGGAKRGKDNEFKEQTVPTQNTLRGAKNQGL
jgi:hypothetical protein